jgi:ParB-like chromosome segregation protein Spo0J
VVSAEVKRAARNLAAARARLNVAVQEAKRVALAELANGETEKDLAVALGVNRLTIRDWQGKSRKALATEPG